MTDDDITALPHGERRVVELSSLSPAPYNPHDITDRDVETVAGSMREFGYLETIIVNKRTGHIVAGHTRVRSLMENGFERAEVLFIDVDEVKEKRLNLLLNHQADFDDDKMTLLLKSLANEGVALDNLGLTDRELDRWLKGQDLGGADTEEDSDMDQWERIVSCEAVSAPGQVYSLGRHKLLCGDATNPDHFRLLFQDPSLSSDSSSTPSKDNPKNNRPAAIAFYSPPYNIGSLQVKGDENTQKKYLDTEDTMDDFSYFSLLQDSLTLCLQYCDDVLTNVMIAASNKGPILSFMEKNSDKLKDVVYWVKSSAAPHIALGVMNNNVELILAFGDGKRKFTHAQWSQGTMPNVIQGDLNRLNPFHKVHKAVFPLYLPVFVLEHFSPPSSIVLDPFGGTGTTLIAAERTGRTCYMIEKNPHYCDVIRERYRLEVEGNPPEDELNV